MSEHVGLAPHCARCGHEIQDHRHDTEHTDHYPGVWSIAVWECEAPGCACFMYDGRLPTDPEAAP